MNRALSDLFYRMRVALAIPQRFILRPRTGVALKKDFRHRVSVAAFRFRFKLILFAIPLCSIGISHAKWVETAGPKESGITALRMQGQYLFAGTGSGLYRSPNNGDSWSKVGTGLKGVVYNLTVAGTYLFAGTDSGMFRSGNEGSAWTPINSGLMEPRIAACAATDRYIFVGTRGGVYRSPDNGDSWVKVNTGLKNTDIGQILVKGAYLFAAIEYGGLYRSTNNGDSWSLIDLGQPNASAHYLSVIGEALFADFTPGGIYRSPDNGDTWIAANTEKKNFSSTCFVASGDNIFLGTLGGSVYQMASTANTWTKADTGLANNLIFSLGASDTYLFVGASGGVWRRPLAELSSGIISSPNARRDLGFGSMPGGVLNAGSRIEFFLGGKASVHLSIFDAGGRKAITLVNTELLPGNHSTPLTGSNLSNGRYFLRMTAGETGITKPFRFEK
jgi:photosystem II stability/assembly factor-like uncharacterized protein